MQAITLLSDLGTGNTSVSIAKAAFMECAPGAVILDISHEVAAYDLLDAAYLLRAYFHFPAGTIHVLAADIYAGKPARLLLAVKDTHYFIAPDNGLLPLAFGSVDICYLCREYSTGFTFRDWIDGAAKVIERVLRKDLDAFTARELTAMPRLLQPKAVRDGVDCNVLCIDRYGNVVLDLTRLQFDALVQHKPFTIKLLRADNITSLSNNYNDVPEGKPLCRFNAAGYLEIAFHHAKAATLLGFSEEDENSIRYRTIKIFTA